MIWNKYRMSLYIPNNSHRNHQSTRKSRFFAGNTTKTLTKTSSNAGCSGIYALDLRTKRSSNIWSSPKEKWQRKMNQLFHVTFNSLSYHHQPCQPGFFWLQPSKNGKSTVHPPFCWCQKKIISINNPSICYLVQHKNQGKGQCSDR